VNFSALISMSIIVGVTIISTRCQNHRPNEFTSSPTEHVIVSLSEPFIVRNISGSVIEKGGFHEPLPDVLIEVRAIGGSRDVMQTKTDRSGKFRVQKSKQGTYEFKATRNGFQSVTGRIIVSDSAPPDGLIRLEMRLGV
jgi:hypothetical protein